MARFKQKWLFVVCIGLVFIGLSYFWFTRPTLVETGITLVKAGKLKEGMTYEEVVEVIGCKPGTYNEFLKNTNPSLREGKGREFTVEDADIQNVSLNTDKYDHVYWSDFNGIQIKVMFTKDTHLVHRIDTYKYIPEENAFRYAKPTLEAIFSSDINVVAISEDEAVKIALAHLKQDISDHDKYEAEARMDEVTKEWTVFIVYKPERPGDHVIVAVDSATKKVIRVAGGK